MSPQASTDDHVKGFSFYASIGSVVEAGVAEILIE